LHDIAVLRTFPDMQVVLPCDVRQTRRLVQQLVDYPHPVYVRVGRNAVPDVYENDNFKFTIGKANILLEGKDITIIGCGETVHHCLAAGLALKKRGINARVIDMHTLKPADTETIIRAACETKKIVTVEEHSIFGGLGALVAETVVQHYPIPVRILGIPDENAINGKPLEIFHHYGIDTEGIIKTVMEFL
jgi:transketolase